MKYYSYHKTTGVFLWEDDATPNPEEEGEFLLPAHATTEAPPEIQANEVAVFTEGAWSIVPDYRGKVFYDGNGDQITINEINVSPDPAWTIEPPPISLQQAIEAKQAEIKALYNDKIADGFVYGGNTYQINTNSRLDMTAVMTDFLAGASNAHGGYWRSQDNVMVAMNDTEVQAFIVAVKAYMAAIYAAQWTHKDVVSGLADVAAVEAYDITTGWPVNS